MVKIRYMNKNETEIISSMRKNRLGEFIEDRFVSFIKKNPQTIIVACDESNESGILGYAFSYLWRKDTGIIHHIVVPRSSDSIVEMELITYLEGLFIHRGLKKSYAWAREDQGSLIKHLLDFGFSMDCEMVVFERNQKIFPSVISDKSKEIKIETFDKGHLKDMMNIERQCFKPSWHQTEDDFLRYTKRPNTRFLVAVKDRSAVGYLQIAASKNLGYIGRVAVLPGYQRQGIGTLFTGKAMDWFDKKGVEHIKLRSPQSDVPAHNLYRKFGFGETGKEYEFAKVF